jgi:hypothetical protein
MPTLREVQAAFAQGLLSGDAAAVLPYLAEGGAIAPANRLNIYRNTYRGTLVSALRITYPAVDRLVGETFFEGAAHAFIAAHVPEAANLNAYGGEFPDFLAGFAPAAALPYLPAVARLEWTISASANAPDVPALEAAALSSVPEADQGRIRFRPHPSTRLVELAHDADLIRKAVVEKNEAELAGLAPDPRLFWLIAHRQGIDVVFRRLTEVEARFTAAILEGKPFEDCLSEEGIEAQIALLGEHLATGRFAGYSLAP